MYSTWIPPGGLTLPFGIKVRGSISGNTRIITYIEASFLACIERSQRNQSDGGDQVAPFQRQSFG